MNSTIIEMQGVSLRYDRRVVLNDIDFSVRRGDFRFVRYAQIRGRSSHERGGDRIDRKRGRRPSSAAPSENKGNGQKI